MRHMYRTMFVALLAVLALSAVGSASASAAECKHTLKSTTFCIENKAVTGEVPFTAGRQETATYSLIMYVEGLRWQCTAVGGAGVLHANGTEGVPVTHDAVELSNCSIPAESSCKIREPVILGKESGALGLEGEVTLSGGEFKLTTFPVTGTTLGTFHVLSQEGRTCLLEGSWPIKSEKAKEGLTCPLADVKTEAIKHNISCTGELWAGGIRTESFQLSEAASLSGTNAGKKWSLWEQ